MIGNYLALVKMERKVCFDPVPITFMYKQVVVEGPDWRSYILDRERFRHRILQVEALMSKVLLKKTNLFKSSKTSTIQNGVSQQTPAKGKVK